MRCSRGTLLKSCFHVFVAGTGVHFDECRVVDPSTSPDRPFPSEVVMHEKRNFILVLLLAGSLLWALVAWFASGSIGGADSGVWFQRIVSLTAAVGLGGALTYALRFEDRYGDFLEKAVGPVYYEVDGLCFMPVVRIDASGAAELSLYYQNRFENPAHAVVHLRSDEECFVVKSGMKDIHLAFICGGGDFGVIHQPIRVPPRLRGQVVDVKLAAATRYPRAHGTQIRSHTGMPCGTLKVDWGGAAFRTGVHEISGEIDLEDPATLHLAMPRAIRKRGAEPMQWRQEHLAAS